jgi:hypothetical protein
MEWKKNAAIGYCSVSYIVILFISLLNIVFIKEPVSTSHDREYYYDKRKDNFGQ